MAFDPKVKAYVRRYYVYERLALEVAAQKAGVSVVTARRWKREAEEKGDDWDKARDVQVMAGGEIEDISKGMLSGFLIEFKAVMTEIKDNEQLASTDKVELLGKLADSFAKMTASSKRLLPNVSELATAMKTVELFGEYLQKAHPALVGDFLDTLKGFGEVLERSFGERK